MLVRLTAQAQIPEFVRACGYEHVFGSRALTALRAYGLEDDRARFYLCKDQNGPAAALYEANSVLTVSARPDAASEPVAELARETRVGGDRYQLGAVFRAADAFGRDHRELVLYGIQRRRV